MQKFHEIEGLSIEKDIIRLTVDGLKIQSNIKVLSSTLANAKEEELQNYEISPSGYGIHWPLIDEDIAIDGLLGLPHSSLK